MLASGVEMLAAGVLLLAAGRLRGEFVFGELSAMPRQTILAILYLASVGSLLGFTAYSWLLQHEPANRVSSYAFVNPVVAVLLGVTLGGERFTAPIALACLSILAGVGLSFFGARLGRPRLSDTEPEA
jgi:drug/metabolite transporter (DMT)-like permease